MWIRTLAPTVTGFRIEMCHSPKRHLKLHTAQLQVQLNGNQCSNTLGTPQIRYIAHKLALFSEYYSLFGLDAVYILVGYELFRKFKFFVSALFLPSLNNPVFLFYLIQFGIFRFYF